MSTDSSKRSKTRKRVKPDRPYEGFPLFPHASGQWCKKIRGEFFYFGVWDDPQSALREYLRQNPNAHDPPAGFLPVDDTESKKTLSHLCNAFLTKYRIDTDAGEKSERSFSDYYRVCRRMVDHFGAYRNVEELGPSDFTVFKSKLSKTMGAVALRNEMTRCRVVFNSALKNRLIDQPVFYGDGFDNPSALREQKERNEGGEKLFERDEVHSLLEVAAVQLRAMILLGLNCGFGNSDIAQLPVSAVDLESGWLSFPRPKTQVPRRIPLWPETIEAMKEAVAHRPQPLDRADSGLCFLTQQGRRWVRVKAKEATDDEKSAFSLSTPIDALSQKFGKLLRKKRCPECGRLQAKEEPAVCEKCEWHPTELQGWTKINGRRGLGFYTFRHCFETYAGECVDQAAINKVMGHKDLSMADRYRQRISDERLQAVVNTVRDWLFGE